jgi:hypothetical protein
LQQSVIDIEKDRVEALKTMANSQSEKNNILKALATAIQKIADK